MAPIHSESRLARHGGDQGLALTSAHLGDNAPSEGTGTDQLHIVWTLTENPLGGFANCRKGLGLYVIKCFAVGKPLPELVSLCPQLIVGEPHKVGFDRIDQLGQLLEFLQLLAFTGVKDFAEDCHEKDIVGTEMLIATASMHGVSHLRKDPLPQVPPALRDFLPGGGTDHLSVQGDQLFAEGVKHSLVTGVEAQLVQDVPDVVLDRVLGNEQTLANFAAGQSPSH